MRSPPKGWSLRGHWRSLDPQEEGQGGGVKESISACINYSVDGVGDILRGFLPKGRIPQGRRGGKWLP